MTNELNIVFFPGEWELWFLNDQCVFSDHRMEAMELMERLPSFGPNFTWSWVRIEDILEDDDPERRNVFVRRASEMPRTFSDLQRLFTKDELLMFLDRLDENRSRP